MIFLLTFASVMGLAAADEPWYQVSGLRRFSWGGFDRIRRKEGGEGPYLED